MGKVHVVENKPNGKPWEGVVLEHTTPMWGRRGMAFKVNHVSGGKVVVRQRQKGKYAGLWEARTMQGIPTTLHKTCESALLQVQHKIWVRGLWKTYVAKNYNKATWNQLAQIMERGLDVQLKNLAYRTGFYCP